VTLPISVALFRATGPAMNTAVAFYVAHWIGYEPSLAQMIAATAVGAVMSYGAVSLPGEVSYISSIAPIALALGVPIAPLGLLVAVEMVPDIFRTVGNVTHDVALASIVNRDRGERLLSFQVFDLPGKLMNLLLKTGGFRRSIITRHGSSPDQGQHPQQSLHKALPGFHDLHILRILRL